MLRDLPPFARDDEDALVMTFAPDEEDTHFDPFDDVFGSAPASPTLNSSNQRHTERHTGPSSNLDHSDIPRLRNTHVTSGYRDGISTSKEQYMQDGFDEGYSLGAELGLKAGLILGALEGMLRAMPATHPQVESPAVGGDNVTNRTELAALLETAKSELDLSHLCGKVYFGEDGLWLYEVPGQESGEHNMTFERVAAAHPVLREWMDRVTQLSSHLGLRVGGF